MKIVLAGGSGFLGTHLATAVPDLLPQNAHLK
jgi:hypothetical protein